MARNRFIRLCFLALYYGFARYLPGSMTPVSLGAIDEIHLPPMAEPDNASWFVYVIRLAESFTQADRDAILTRLRESGIGCSPYFVPVHTQPHVMAALGTKAGDFPVTERLPARTLALPFFGEITDSQVEQVKSALRRAIGHI